MKRKERSKLFATLMLIGQDHHQTGAPLLDIVSLLEGT